jgi:hypothetical protein
MSWKRSRDLRTLDDAYYDATGAYMSLHDEVLGALCKHQATYLDKRFRFTQPTGNPNRTYKVVNLDTSQLIPLDEKLVTGIPAGQGGILFGHTTEFLGIRGNGSFHTYSLNAITFDVPQNGDNDLDTQVRELERTLHKNWSRQIRELERVATERLRSLVGRDVDYVRRSAGNWAQNMVQSNLGGIRYCPYVHGIHLYVDSDAGYETIDNPTNVKHIWS